tara:strand:- start:150 stop:263 length:114 start_codon:yes stop_codon:yes gene_type:complete
MEAVECGYMLASAVVVHYDLPSYDPSSNYCEEDFVIN